MLFFFTSVIFSPMKQIAARKTNYSKVLVAAFLIALLGLSGCAESAGSGKSVAIPIVDVTCTTPRCRAAASARAFLVYTTSACANSAFGETVAGSTTLTCNATGCRGNVSAFTSSAGVSANTIREGFYSVCVVVDFNANYIGAAVAGEDANGALNNSLINSSSPSQAVTSFVDI